MTKQVEGFQILFVSEKDLDDHEQAMLEKLLRSVDIDQRQVALTNMGRGRGCVWLEIQSVNPRVIITLGKEVARVLLHEKKSFKLEPHVGKIHNAPHLGEAVIIVPIQSMSFLLGRGIKDVHRTISILKCCKGLSC